MNLLRTRIQDPKHSIAVSPEVKPQVLTQFASNGATGPTKLHTVVPLPHYSSTPPKISELKLASGGSILKTAAAPCAWLGNGRVSQVELIAVGHPDMEVQVVQVPGAPVDELPSLAELPFQTLELLNSSPEFRLSEYLSKQQLEVHSAGLLVEALRGEDDYVSHNQVYSAVEINTTFAGCQLRIWAKFYRQVPIVELDFDLQNALADPRGHLVFESFFMTLAKGWRAVSKVPVPTFHNRQLESGPCFYFADAEKDMGKGTAHVIGMHRSYEGRLVLYPEGYEEMAQSFAQLRGFGVCNNQAQGYDWFGLDAPSFNPHATPLPRLDNDIPAISDGQVAKWNFTKTALASGGKIVSELGDSGRLPMGGGFLQPWGPSYGGVTGGGGLGMRNNVEAMATGDAEAFLQLMFEHWADGTSRPTVHLVEEDGEPFDFSVTEHGRVFLNPGAESWSTTAPGITSDWSDFNAVCAKTLALAEDLCPYINELRGQGMQDSQHGGRYLQDCATLARALNDPIAKRHLELRANTMWFESRDNYNESRGIANRGIGDEVGREDAWRIRTMTEALQTGALQRRPWRLAGAVTWLERAVLFMREIQMPTGLSMRNHRTKYATELTPPGASPIGIGSSWHDPMIADSVYGAVIAVLQFMDGDAEATQAGFDYIDGVVRGVLWSWDHNAQAPWDHFAVAKDGSSAPYELFTDVPYDQKRDHQLYWLPPLIVSAGWAAVRLKDPERMARVQALIAAYLGDRTLELVAATGFEDSRNMKAPLLWLAQQFTTEDLGKLSIPGNAPAGSETSN